LRAECRRRGLFPEARRAYVAQQLRDAYDSATVTTAKKKLEQLASWLDLNGETSAAASLLGGPAETLTILRFNLPKAMRKRFATTNAIENMKALVSALRPMATSALAEIKKVA